MSVVTDVILVAALHDGGARHDEHPNVDKLNAWLRDLQLCGEALVKVDQYAGCGKAMQCDVFVAAINHLNREGLLGAFRSIPWDNPHSAQLMLKGEDNELFTVCQLNFRGQIVVLDPREPRLLREDESLLVEEHK